MTNKLAIGFQLDFWLGLLGTFLSGGWRQYVMWLTITVSGALTFKIILPSSNSLSSYLEANFSLFFVVPFKFCRSVR